MRLSEVTKIIHLNNGMSLHVICTFPPPTSELRVLWAFGNKKHGIKAYLDGEQNLGLIYFDGDYMAEVKHSDSYRNITLSLIDDSPQHIGCQIIKDKNFYLQLFFNGELSASVRLDQYSGDFEEKLQLGSDFDGSHHIGRMYLRRTTFWPSSIDQKLIKDFYNGQ